MKIQSARTAPGQRAYWLKKMAAAWNLGGWTAMEAPTMGLPGPLRIAPAVGKTKGRPLQSVWLRPRGKVVDVTAWPLVVRVAVVV
mmetsp:Transcript_112164/g.222919  ORF Transcript_112164/g.222919 Transcript_112164/m.222919 type:complete len:85 (+) Transcript_112164:807-1061(+)